jgi:drug/metabolite transporter (DMT)-like permease
MSQVAVAPPTERRIFGLSVPVIMALFALYVIWGSTYFAIRLAIETIPPLLMAGTRFIIAGSLLFVFLRARGEAIPPLRQWRWALIFSILLLVMGNGGVTFAEQYITSSAAALIVATMPLWAALWMTLRGKRPTARDFIGMGLGFSGIVLLNMQGDISANPLGVLLVVMATIGWSYGSVWKKHVTDATPGLMGAAMEMLCAGAIMALLGVLRGEQITQVPSLNSTLAYIYLIIFGSLIAYTAYLYLLQRVRPTLATSYAYVNPVVAVVLGVGFGGEPLSAFGILAMIIILSGVALILGKRE